VPVNVKDRDVFHLTIEEYLLALISLLDELVRSQPATHPYSAIH
jgi:hypothetical protein